MLNKLEQLKQDLEKLKNPAKAKILARFFKTGKGEYGEGDEFLGIMMPKQRQMVKKYLDLGLGDLQKLLDSKIHEQRMTGLLILREKYGKSKGEGGRRIKRGGQGGLLTRLEADKGVDEKEQIYRFYLRNTKNINNWDLVDLSSPQIVGQHLLKRPRQILYKLAKSKNLWERRIAILACFAFIRKGEFGDGFKIVKMLIGDKHDLIHKAGGWMLREIGKRDEAALEKFLREHHKKMPRTMLRYAIEQMDDGRRRKYLIR